jgi:hypothetical protein
VTFQPLGLFSPYDIHQASRNYDIWDPLPFHIFKTSYLLRIVNLPHLCAQTSRVKVVSQARGLHCMGCAFLSPSLSSYRFYISDPQKSERPLSYFEIVFSVEHRFFLIFNLIGLI